MAKPTYEFVQSPNCKIAGRKPITTIVIHFTGSLHLSGTVAWFLDPASKVSAHYVVGRSGEVVQMVQDERVAWHAGASAMFPHLPKGNPAREENVNAFSLGIELVGTPDSGFTDRQLASLYSLLELLVVKYKIKPERVVGHLHIAPGRKIDPDGFDHQYPWAKTRQIATDAYSAAMQGHLPKDPVT